MSFRFNEAFREHVTHCCAEFTRIISEDLTLKPAAVAITLLESEDGSGITSILLTRRASGLRTHSSQWALPGGRCDYGETSVETALRELNEEVGLCLSANDVLGILDNYPTRSGYLITPVVVWGGYNRHISPNPQEVDSVHRISLTELTRPQAVEFGTIPESDRQLIRIHIHAYEGFIHAPTGALIYQFCEVLAGRNTRVSEFDQPVFAWR